MNPYQSPEATSQDTVAETTVPLPAVGESLGRTFRWSLLLVASGLFLLALWFLQFVLVGVFELYELPLFVSVLIMGMGTLAKCLLLGGYLAAVYTPSSFRVSKFAMAAAALELVFLSGRLDVWVRWLHPQVALIFHASLPSLVMYLVLLCLLGYQLKPWRGYYLIRRGVIGAGTCLAAGSFVSLLANVGGESLPEEMLLPEIVLWNSIALMIAAAYSWLGLQLLLARQELASLNDADAPQDPKSSA